MPPGSPAPPPDLTVVVVTHQSDHLIGSCLDRLLAAGLDRSTILVVDNASTDRTVALARARGVAVVETGRNAGFGAGCNTGLARVGTRFVAFANPDLAIPRADILAVLGALRDDPAAAAAGPLLRAGAPSVRGFATLASDLAGFAPGRLHARLQRALREVPLRPEQLAAPVAADYAEGAFLACRAAAVRAVGGFDERFFLYGEEEDLCRRLGRAGWRTLVVPTARADHARTTSSKGASPRTLARHRMRSRYLFYRKHRSRAYAEVARAALGLALVLDRALRVVLRRRRAYAPGTLRALLGAHRAVGAGGGATSRPPARGGALSRPPAGGGGSPRPSGCGGAPPRPPAGGGASPRPPAGADDRGHRAAADAPVRGLGARPRTGPCEAGS